MRIGEFECHEIVECRFRLDGGAMFGSVPKILWEKAAPADELNRIRMAARTLLAARGDRRVLIDTGLGRKFPKKALGMYAIDHEGAGLTEGLARCGLKPGDVTDVVITHLHFDHAGGAVERDDKGELKLVFPNARFWVHKDNAALAKAPNPKDRASYLQENVLPILESGRVSLIEDGGEFLPGISAVMCGGHTPGMICPRLSSGGKTLLFCADLIPTAAHIPLPYVMGYDLHASRTLEEKKAVLEAAAREGTLLYFEHDPDIAACTVVRDEKGRFLRGEVVNMSPAGTRSAG